MPRFFDCCARYGTPMVPPDHKYARTPVELLDEMEFCGVAQALVTCEVQRGDAATIGNQRLVAEISHESRLCPAWVALPPQTREQGTPGNLLADMAKHDVRALWLLPEKGRYVPDPLTLGPLFEIMIPAQVPFLVSLLEVEWPAVYALMRDFPELRLIVTDQSNWGQDRNFRPLLEAYEHFHVDIASYELAGGLEECCRLYGAQQFVFGTDYPRNPMGGPMLRLARADLPDGEIAAIAGGNLTRLLEEVRF